jgi:RimJ/RimL family protein N-acetyltransferase
VTVVLRDVTEADLPAFFEHQRDPDAVLMAAFPPREWESFMAHWKKVLADDTGLTKTIVCDGEVAGNVVSFERGGVREVGYWVAQSFWGRGVATAALSQFLTVDPTRPLHARVARHNLGSLRVLEKCGFMVEARHADPLGDGVDEVLLRLDA